MNGKTGNTDGRKKLKYGAAAIIFTVAVIALVIILNVVFTSLADKYLWSVDMTSSQLFTLSDETKDLLDGKVDESGKEIRILFCMPLDKLVDEKALNLVYQTALEYQKRYDNIKVDSIDIITNPSLVNKYSNISNSRITQRTVIVETDDDFRTFTVNSFFAYYSDTPTEVSAYSGELRFTTAILQLLSDKPVAYFTTMHGETTGNENSRPALWGLFENAGYDVREIDLSKDGFEANAQVLIMNGPRYDLDVNGKDVDEVNKISDFLKNYGSLMVFIDPETEELPELEGLLEEWGVAVEKAIVKDFSSTISTDGTKLSAVYTTEGIASSLTNQLKTYDTLPKTIVNYARPISIVWGKDGTKTMDDISVREASPVLTTTKNAVAYAYDNETELKLKAPFDLMTITRGQQISNNESYYSYVLVCGSTQFASDDYLYNEAYANDEILYAAMRIMGKSTVPVGVKYKFLDDNKLDITKEEANAWTLRVTLILPVIVLIAGAVIQIRRRHL